jgi:uncharacterized damage-inducible protein DinB
MKVEWILSNWERVRKGLIDTIDKFTEEDLTYIAYEGGYSVGQIMLHIAQEELGEIQYGITRDLSAFPPLNSLEEYPTIALIKALLDHVHMHTYSFIEQLDDEDLFGEVEAQWGGKYTLIDMIWHVIEHEIHHRGELSFILGLLGREGLDA